jgi:nucleoside-diphosphate-sugar epimerase
MPAPARRPPLPDRIAGEDQLDELLSEPTPGVVECLGRLDGDLLVLGVAGKMGPTLARMAVRASREAGVRRRVIGVARYTQSGVEEKLRRADVETLRCDLLDPKQLAALPDAPNVVAMQTLKFGASREPSLAWAVNTQLSGQIADRFAGSRIVGFSTGNVYPLTPVVLGGSRESDPPGPVGEYAMTCLGKERLYDAASRRHGTPTAVLRLNYACELRYGVLVDLARQVWKEEAIDVSMGCVNVLWQGDANAMALCALEHAASPPFVINLAGPETLSVRRVCAEFSELLDRPARFIGTESPDALLSNGQDAHRLFGYPRVPVGQLIRWIADWVRDVGVFLDKPTKFQVRTGAF